MVECNRLLTDRGQLKLAPIGSNPIPSAIFGLSTPQLTVHFFDKSNNQKGKT